MKLLARDNPGAAVPDRMSVSEIQEYIALANEDLSAAQDNLRLGHLRAAVSRGRILHDAFEARLDSDYAPHPDLNEASARQLITNADEFVRRMIRFLSEHPPVDEADDAPK
jgi:uncharacterized protein (UPF0332 family)